MNDEREVFEVINSDGSKLQFTGELVYEVSSQVPEKPRWTEFKLYLSDFNTWILQGMGGSRVPGEVDRYWYVVSSEPIDWLDKIIGDDASRLAKKLIAGAFHYLKDCD